MKLPWLCALLLIFITAFAVLFAQDEEGGPVFQCGPIAEGAVHECHCAHMVEDGRAAYLKKCNELKDKKERETCRDHVPAICDMMDYPSRYGLENHPDQCGNKCSKERCTCNEHACSRPPEGKKKKG